MKKHSAVSFEAHAATDQACLRATSASRDYGRNATGSVLLPAQLLSHILTFHANSESLSPGAELYRLLVSDLLGSIDFRQVAPDSTYFTGISILNTNKTGATTTVDVYDRNGNLVRMRTKPIGAKQRVSKPATQYFEDLVGQDRASGFIEVTVDKGLASFALFGTNDLSVLSAIPPHVVP